MTNTSVNCMKCHLSIIKWWDFNKHLLGFRCVSIPVFLFPSFSSTVGQMECKRKYHAHRRPFTHTLWWNHVMLFHNVITLHLGLWHKWKEYSGNYQYFHRTGKCERWDDGNWKYWRPTYSSCFEGGKWEIIELKTWNYHLLFLHKRNTLISAPIQVVHEPNFERPQLAFTV